MITRSRHIVLLCAVMTMLISHNAISQSSPRAWSGSEIQKGIEHLSSFGSVLYVAAHPDDENTAFLATMVNGAGVRTGYVSMTRGEGGQNLIGPEQGSLLGMIRSQELLEARRVDGAEQFFTRAIDFGYSKTTEETLEFWGKDAILADLVYIIRSFRPDVIVSRFTPERGGHGNHTSSALLAIEAFDAASDPERFPEQVGSVSVWAPTRIVWNGFRFRQSDPVEISDGVIVVDLGEYDPILGVSYSELAGKARSMHKSQGFGASQSRGEYLNTFEHLKGQPAQKSLFDDIDLTWNRFSGGGRIAADIASLSESFSVKDPSRSIQKLFALQSAMRELGDHPDVQRKIQQVEDLILACGGLWVDVTTDRRSYARGDSISVRLEVVNRSAVPFSLDGWTVAGLGISREPSVDLNENTARSETERAQIPANMAFSAPLWLQERPTAFTYVLPDMQAIGVPESPPAFVTDISFGTPFGIVVVQRPVRYRTVDPVAGETYAPIRIIPRVTAAFTDQVLIYPLLGGRDVQVRISAHAEVRSARLSLDLPAGWEVEPERMTLENLTAGEERNVSFRVSRTSDAVSGTLSLRGVAEEERITFSLKEALYDHIPPQSLLEPATAQLIAADIRTNGGKLGYVMGAGDAIPEGLRQIGYEVDLLTDNDLVSSDLSGYTAILAGVRAYNTRPVLEIVDQRLRTYMEQGGVFIAQYRTTSRTGQTAMGPYPMTIGRDRVTDEKAAMRMLQPDHPILQTPNRISNVDFEGWVQERGLYFARSWDDNYTPLFASNDPGEDELRGSLLVARVGRGTYIYTGLSFFRQIPAGVPGAFRLLANMISAGANRQ